MPEAQAAASEAINALFFDGEKSQPRAVRLQIGAGGVIVLGDGLQRGFRWNGVRISEQLQHAPRVVRFGDGTFCEVSDRNGLARALQAVGYQDSWVARAQARWPYVLAAVAALVAGILALYRWGLPVAADYAARRVPPAIEARIGRQAVRVVEQRFAPTQLNGEQAGRVWRLFESIAPHDGRDFRVVLRDGGPVGANAFALPGGTIVVTDQLVKLAPDDAALQGVLAHEIGHVENRHLMRRVISSTVIGAVVTLIAGDVSGVAAGLPAALAELSYTRDMEREADAYAVELLKAHQIPAQPLADLLQRLQQAHDADAPAGWARYLQTHPDTQERIAAIRAAQ